MKDSATIKTKTIDLDSVNRDSCTKDRLSTLLLGNVFRGNFLNFHVLLIVSVCGMQTTVYAQRSTVMSWLHIRNRHIPLLRINKHGTKGQIFYEA